MSAAEEKQTSSVSSKTVSEWKQSRRSLPKESAENVNWPELAKVDQNKTEQNRACLLEQTIDSKPATEMTGA